MHRFFRYLATGCIAAAILPLGLHAQDGNPPAPTPDPHAGHNHGPGDGHNHGAGPVPMPGMPGGGMPQPDPAKIAQRLAFLPEVIASFDPDHSITRDEFIEFHGPDLGWVLNPKITDDEIKFRLGDAVVAQVNQLLLGDLAAADGYTRDLEAAKKAALENFGPGVLQHPEGQTIIESMADQLRVQNWIEKEFVEKSTVESAEVAAFYEQNKEQVPVLANPSVRFAVIVIPAQEPQGVEAGAQKTRADAVAAKAAAGEDFGTLARAHSADRATAEVDGDVGYMEITDLPPEIQTATKDMKIGDTAGPLLVRNTYHIIKLTGRREAGKIPLDDGLRQDIERFLSYQKVQAAIGARLEKESQTRNLQINL